MFGSVEFKHGLDRCQRIRRVRRQNGEQLQGCRDRDAGTPDVRIVAHAERLGHVGDLLAFGQTACRASIGLDDIDRPRRQQVAKAEPRELAFSTRDRDRDRRFDFAISRDILRRHRLLEPSDVARLDHSAETDRGDGVIGMVGIDHQCDAGPDRFPHGARHRGIFFDTETDLEFYGLEAFRDIAGRFFGKVA